MVGGGGGHFAHLELQACSCEEELGFRFVLTNKAV